MIREKDLIDKEPEMGAFGNHWSETREHKLFLNDYDDVDKQCLFVMKYLNQLERDISEEERAL
jgi:hypothetical protein